MLSYYYAITVLFAIVGAHGCLSESMLLGWDTVEEQARNTRRNTYFNDTGSTSHIYEHNPCDSFRGTCSKQRGWTADVHTQVSNVLHGDEGSVAAAKVVHPSRKDPIPTGEACMYYSQVVVFMGRLLCRNSKRENWRSDLRQFSLISSTTGLSNTVVPPPKQYVTAVGECRKTNGTSI